MRRTTLLLVSLAALSCDASDAAAPAPAEPPASGAPAAREVVPVVSKRLDYVTSLPGELTAFESVAIHPRVQAFVEEVRVDRGSRVSKGQLIARLSAPELSAQRAEAEAKLTADRTTVERLRAAAAQPGVVAPHDLELAHGVVAAGEAHVRSLKTLESLLVVRAPFDGVISERNVHPGALVGPSAAGAIPMFRLDQISRLRLTVAVPEEHLSGLAEDAPAQFTVRTWPGRTFTGIIRRPAATVDPRTRTMPVELDVANADGALAPGMYADVRWPVHRRSPSLVVPPSAVVQTPVKVFVDRVKDGVVEQVPVTRGIALKDEVEVVGPLAAGDLVLRRGAEDLKDGTKVATRLASPETGGKR